MKRRPQLLHGSHVQSIEHFRPVHRDISNRVFLFQKNVFKVHKFQPATDSERIETDFKMLHDTNLVILSEAKDLCNLLAAPVPSPQALELLCGSASLW